MEVLRGRNREIVREEGGGSFSSQPDRSRHMAAPVNLNTGVHGETNIDVSDRRLRSYRLVPGADEYDGGRCPCMNFK